MKFGSFQRLLAIWLLLCLTWFNTGASFAHTCSGKSGGHETYMVANSGSCVVCDWQAAEKDSPIQAIRFVEQTTLVNQEFVQRVPQHKSVKLILASSRAPPSHSN